MSTSNEKVLWASDGWDQGGSRKSKARSGKSVSKGPSQKRVKCKCFSICFPMHFSFPCSSFTICIVEPQSDEEIISMQWGSSDIDGEGDLEDDPFTWKKL